jgi:glycosyltransferase involved in cell wall biosynthesis
VTDEGLEIRRQLEALRRRHAALEAEADAFRQDAADTIATLLAALDDQRQALEQAIHAAASAGAMRASNSGRLTALAGRWRARWRRVRMARHSGKPAGARAAASFGMRTAPLGVNVAGYIAAESGMGEAARATIRTLQHAGVPVAINDVPGPQRTADRTFTEFDAGNPHPFNLVHLNADNMAAFARDRGRAYFRDRYTIGFWFWELEDFRPDWIPAFAHVDEVWVASEFTCRGVARYAPVPVIRQLPALFTPKAGDFGRAHFDLPPGPFIFLYTFDVSSQMERKNPMGAIEAFRRAGLPGDQAMLVLKFTNGGADAAAVRRLAEAACGLNVRLIDGMMARPEVLALMRAADAGLSLHRAEGFGLTLAEQMAFEKPVIATAYSGNLDFMDEDVARLVPARIVSIDRDYGPYLRGYRWADPDVAVAARFIRELAGAPDRARTLGVRGAAHVRRVLSPDAASSRVVDRLEEVRAGRAAPRPEPVVTRSTGEPVR